jgi:hypothetical protein
MPNHFHLLIQQQETSISTIMRSLATRYAAHFNRRYHKMGHLFQGRFRGILCDQNPYLLELIRYIHLNPVRAHLVEQPQDWKWSSLPAYLGTVKNEWLFQEEVLRLFGTQPKRRLFDFLSQAPDLPRQLVYPHESFPVLGKQSFVSEVTRQGEPRRKQQRVYVGRKLPLPKLVAIFCQAEGMAVDEFLIRHKGSEQVTRLRDQIIYAATELMYYPMSEVARFLKITAAAVTASKRRYRERTQLNPKLKEALVQLLMQNF